MSKQNVSISASGAASEQNSEQHQSEDAPNATKAYEAPYTPVERSRVPGMYVVAFHPNYTIDQHYAFLGREFEVTAFEGGYGAHLDGELFNAIRSDPGVKFVEDNAYGKRH